MSIANTNIQLKKSGVTGNVPASLAYGELALNYADGRLYYKNAAGVITYIQSGTSTNSFSTINSNSSLILATSPLDTLSIVAGNNISISTDSINKKITISSTATGGGGGGGTTGNSTSYIVSDDVFTGDGSQVNFTLSSIPNDVYSVFVNINGVLQLTSSYTVAGNILTFTEAPAPGASIEVKTTIAVTTATVNSVIGLAQAAFDRANIASANTIVTQGIDTWQNTQITYVNQFTQSAYSQANTATGLAQAAFNSANNVAPQVQPAFDKANSAYSLAQSAYDSANNVTPQIQPSFNKANAAYDLAQSAYNSSNAVSSFSQSAYNQANTNSSSIVQLQAVDTTQNNNIIAINQFAQSAYNQANSTIGVNDTQNTRINAIETINTNQNTSISIIQGVDNTQNTQIQGIQGVDNTQNTNITTANNAAWAAFAKANNALANTTGTFAGDLTITGNVTVGNIYGTSVNTSIVAGSYTTTFDSAGKLTLPGIIVFADATTQNTAFVGNAVDSFARTTSNGANGLAQGAYNQANVTIGVDATQNSNISIIQGVDLTQNTRLDGIEGTNLTQNTNITSVNQFAQGAYNTANSKLSLSGGTLTGPLVISANSDLTVTGNLVVLGNTFSVGTQTLEVTDPLIILGIGNYTTDVIDIGFAGHYNAGSNAHTGLFRDATTKDWYLFQGYTPELTGNNDININHASFDTANLIVKKVTANVVATTVTISGRDQASVDVTQNTNITSVNQFAQSAYDTANGANGLAAGAYSSSNTNATNITAVNNYAASGYTLANTNATNITAVNNYATSAYGLANTNSTNISIIQGVDTWQNTQITYVNQFAAAAYNKANAGISSSNTFITVNSNSTLINASSNTDVLTLLPGNNITFITDAVNKKITIASTVVPVSVPTLAPTRTTFTAASAQTSIAIIHTTPYVYVSINGITVDPSEYTANGTHVVLTTALRVGDIVDVTGYQTGTSTLSGIKGDSFTSNTTLYVTDIFATGRINIGQVQLANVSSNLVVYGVNDIVANTSTGTLSLADAISQVRYANGVNNTQNTNINSVNQFAQGAYNTANTNATNISIIQSVNTWQNTQITAINQFAQSAYDTANTKFSSSGGNITGAVTILGNNSLNVTGNLISTSVYTSGSLGVGTLPSGVVGEIRAANNITSYYTSDRQYKENIIDIPNALDKVDVIGGKLFDWTDSYLESRGGVDDYFMRKSDFGVIAQDVQEVFPVAVRTKQDGTLAVDYEKLSALAFAAIKELRKEIDELKGKK